MFAQPEDWPVIHRGLTKGLPQPPALKEETPDVIAGYVNRIRRNFDTLRQQLEAARPEVLVMIGDDQTEVFSGALVPAMAIFLGEEASGTTSLSWIQEKPEANRVTLKGHPAVARTILERLTAARFDVSFTEELTPLGKPANGLGHAFVRLGKVLGIAESQLPTVIFFLNAYHPPLPSGRRCYELGQALRMILDACPQRVALLASGGLSHDPLGPRAGWIDEPLDRWLLDRLAAGENEALINLFTFDSATMRSGTGEIRGWITAAGAVTGMEPHIVDYLPAYHAVTGLGFAYWTARSA